MITFPTVSMKLISWLPQNGWRSTCCPLATITSRLTRGGPKLPLLTGCVVVVSVRQADNYPVVPGWLDYSVSNLALVHSQYGRQISDPAVFPSGLANVAAQVRDISVLTGGPDW